MAIYNPTTYTLPAAQQALPLFQTLQAQEDEEIVAFSVSSNDPADTMYLITINGVNIYNTDFSGNPPTNAINAYQPWSKTATRLVIIGGDRDTETLRKGGIIAVYAYALNGATVYMDVYVHTKRKPALGPAIGKQPAAQYNAAATTTPQAAQAAQLGILAEIHDVLERIVARL